MERGLAESRNAARGMIMAGLVLVDGVVVDKAGAPVRPEAEIGLKARPRFVSRAGEKLARALAVFELDVRGRRAIDVGASTGGFVDCLLQNGVEAVIAVDVGYGQLDSRLAGDPRVHVLDRVNARYLTREMLPHVPDLLTTDVSFISLEKVLPAVVACMAPEFLAVLLVKPQFEAGPERVGKGGIVRDPHVHEDVLLGVVRMLGERLDLAVRAMCDSGLPGVHGNREFVVWAERGGGPAASLDTLERQVRTVVVGEGGL